MKNKIGLLLLALAVMISVNGQDSKITYVTGTFTDSRDAHVYKTIKIGEQIWMAENLAYLPSVKPSKKGSNSEPYYYVYQYEDTIVREAKGSPNCILYGVLYNWQAAMAGASGSESVPSGVKGVCPDGWHLPSDAEWSVLESNMESNIGGKLKANILWPTNDNEDASMGFNALPGGRRFFHGGLIGLGFSAYFWSSTADGKYFAWYRSFYHNDNEIHRYSYYLRGGLSVRCIKD